MKKYSVLIITLFENNNYGNRLQNLAVVKILESYGISALTIRLSRRCSIPGRIRDAAAKIRDNVKQIINGELKRIIRFNRFSRRYTPSVRVVKRIRTDLRDSLFIVGSDQVWNPAWGIGARDDGKQCAYGVLASKKIALSPSFGVSRLTDEQKTFYKKWLADFSRLSVREEEGAKILKELVNCPVEVLIDPTMALTADQWRQFNKDSNVAVDNYVFIYHLGNFSDRLSQQVVKLASEHNCQTIDIMNKKNPYHLSDPLEWLFLVDNSRYVVTDSFHGCVFALLFHVPFAVYERKEDGQVEMSSRIKTLLKKFNCENRLITEESGHLPSFEMDWISIDDILDGEREEFFIYLEEELLRTGLIAK